eukprot:465102-Pelagomonas_calceolata.AAC.4
MKAPGPTCAPQPAQARDLVIGVEMLKSKHKLGALERALARQCLLVALAQDDLMQLAVGSGQLQLRGAQCSGVAGTGLARTFAVHLRMHSIVYVEQTYDVCKMA